jgi:hypothetical protein
VFFTEIVMREFRIAVFPGDGIGREVMAPCLALLDTIAARIGGFRLRLQSYDAGAELYRDTGVGLPADALEAAEASGGAHSLMPVRYRLIAVTFTLSMLLYVDRIAISTAKGPLSSELGLTDTQFGWPFQDRRLLSS